MLRSVLVQVRPADPVTLARTVLLLTVVCVAAGLIPARRAARLARIGQDPGSPDRLG